MFCWYPQGDADFHYSGGWPSEIRTAGLTTLLLTVPLHPPPLLRGDRPDLKQLNLQGVYEKGKFGNVSKTFVALKQLWTSAKCFEICSRQLPKMSSFITM